MVLSIWLLHRDRYCKSGTGRSTALPVFISQVSIDVFREIWQTIAVNLHLIRHIQYSRGDRRLKIFNGSAYFGDYTGSYYSYLPVEHLNTRGKKCSAV
jgi:hypothetical protein